MQAYSEMKDSGIEWLGRLPGDWDVSRVGSLFKHRNEKVSDKDFEPLSVTKKGIVPQLDDAAKTNDGDNRKKVLTGDFVINSRSDRKGSSGVSPLDGSVSLINTVLSQGKLDSRYTHHLLRSQPFQEEFYRYGQGIVADLWSTNYSRMKAIALPVPPKLMQQKIADFLDTETAQIDNLIAKQERLLELLEEKRRATITHAVTRGLNPSVELKETNIPWLGQIPAHWSVAKIRYLANLKTGSTPKDNEGINQEGDGSGWITPGDFVTDLYINDWSKYVTASAQDKFKIRLFNSPSILFIGIGATAGKIGYVREPVYSNQQITAIMPNSKAVPEYMLYYLHTISGTMRSTASYATLPIINNQFLSTVMHPVPGLTEQREIAHYLDEQDKKVNKLKQKIQTQITLLRERRTSLISHAVTGKIKV